MVSVDKGTKKAECAETVRSAFFGIHSAICDRHKNVLMKHKNSNKSVEECIYGTVDLE